MSKFTAKDRNSDCCAWDTVFHSLIANKWVHKARVFFRLLPNVSMCDDEGWQVGEERAGVPSFGVSRITIV